MNRRVAGSYLMLPCSLYHNAIIIFVRGDSKVKSLSERKPQTESWIKKQITFHVLKEQASFPRDRIYKTVFGVVLAFVAARTVSCISDPDDADTGTSALDSGTLDSEDATRSCHRSKSLDDVDSGVRACVVGQAHVQCYFSSGAGYGCLSDDPTTCSIFGPENGATCTNDCEANEYAVSCGGPPKYTSPDGSIGFSYQEVPEVCKIIVGNPSGNVIACCPCE